MSGKCYNCFKSIQSCLCKYISPIETGIKFVFLMHPKEAYKQKTGTGRLASLSLVNSEIIIDKSFDDNTRVQNLVSDPKYFPMVLYPGKDAHYAESFNFNSDIKGRKLLIFLIDATWSISGKMMHRSKCLQVLPKLSFSREYCSNFRIKRQPADYCLSTIESSYYLIKELQNSEVCSFSVDPSGLLYVFDKMIQYQLDCKSNRIKQKEILNVSTV